MECKLSRSEWYKNSGRSNFSAIINSRRFSVNGIWLFATRSGDPETLKESGGKVVIPENEGQTVLRRNEVLEAK